VTMSMDFAKGITEFRWHGRGGQGGRDRGQVKLATVHLSRFLPRDVIVGIGITVYERCE